jgi:hypothetical protein
MIVQRFQHTATLLPNGTVLVAGGRESFHGRPISSAEIYDPETETWTLAAGFNKILGDNRAVLLPDGEVLAEGAARNGSGWSKFAELYDSTSGTWSLTGTPNGGDGKMTLLLNGLVLAEGGKDAFTIRDDAQLYDPVTQIWSVTRNLQSHRGGHTATLLPDGEVLVTGGKGSDD